MRQGNSNQLRVLHLVSSNGVPGGLQQTLFMPLLCKAPKQRVMAEVVCLAPNALPCAVLRQNGIPVHELPLCRQRFSLAAFSQLLAVAREFGPEVIHAWGYTAHLLAGWLSKRCGSPRVLCSASGTMPGAANVGFLHRQKLKAAARAAAKADRIVYSSEASAAAHRRIGYPEQGHTVISPGVDPTRFKPDPALRRKVREQLAVPPTAFVIGMLAPFQAESDHTTLLKGLGELFKTQPNTYLLLAGHGVQKGNGPLMAQLGSGNLATRTQLLGEWTDVAGFFNACDAAVSSAVTDSGRMNLVMAMLCAVPCVATGVGEQGEVLGQCSVAIEPGSPAAIVRGVTRVIEMPPERRVFLAQSSRKHALKNFAQIRSLQQYLQQYGELLGREQRVEEMLPAPAEAELAAMPVPAAMPAPVVRAVVVEQPADPDALQSSPSSAKEVIDWQPTPLPAAAATPSQIAPAEERTVSDGDVLEIFESARVPQLDEAAIAAMAMATVTATLEVQQLADELEDLLAPELLAANAGEEFRPRQTIAKAKVSAPPAGRDSVASLRSARSGPSLTAMPTRPAGTRLAKAEGPGGSPTNASVKAPASAALKPVAAGSATGPSDQMPVLTPSGDLDATLQLKLLGGSLDELRRDPPLGS